MKNFQKIKIFFPSLFLTSFFTYGICPQDISWVEAYYLNHNDNVKNDSHLKKNFKYLSNFLKEKVIFTKGQTFDDFYHQKWSEILSIESKSNLDKVLKDNDQQSFEKKINKLRGGLICMIEPKSKYKTLEMKLELKNTDGTPQIKKKDDTFEIQFIYYLFILNNLLGGHIQISKNTEELKKREANKRAFYSMIEKESKKPTIHEKYKVINKFETIHELKLTLNETEQVIAKYTEFMHHTFDEKLGHYQGKFLEYLNHSDFHDKNATSTFRKERQRILGIKTKPSSICCAADGKYIKNDLYFLFLSYEFKCYKEFEKIKQLYEKKKNIFKKACEEAEKKIKEEKQKEKQEEQPEIRDNEQFDSYIQKDNIAPMDMGGDMDIGEDIGDNKQFGSYISKENDIDIMDIKGFDDLKKNDVDHIINSQNHEDNKKFAFDSQEGYQNTFNDNDFLMRKKNFCSQLKECLRLDETEIGEMYNDLALQHIPNDLALQSIPEKETYLMPLIKEEDSSFVFSKPHKEDKKKQPEHKTKRRTTNRRTIEKIDNLKIDNRFSNSQSQNLSNIEEVEIVNPSSMYQSQNSSKRMAEEIESQFQNLSNREEIEIVNPSSMRQSQNSSKRMAEEIESQSQSSVEIAQQKEENPSPRNILSEGDQIILFKSLDFSFKKPLLNISIDEFQAILKELSQDDMNKMIHDLEKSIKEKLILQSQEELKKLNALYQAKNMRNFIDANQQKK